MGRYDPSNLTFVERGWVGHLSMSKLSDHGPCYSSRPTGASIESLPAIPRHRRLRAASSASTVRFRPRTVGGHKMSMKRVVPSRSSPMIGRVIFSPSASNERASGQLEVRGRWVSAYQKCSHIPILVDRMPSVSPPGGHRVIEQIGQTAYASTVLSPPDVPITIEPVLAPTKPWSWSTPTCMAPEQRSSPTSTEPRAVPG
jgi:hypothetical protein